MTLFADDPTLPGNRRKRKRGRGLRGVLFLHDDNDSSGKLMGLNTIGCYLVVQCNCL